jgi:hypothetical protein
MEMAAYPIKSAMMAMGWINRIRRIQSHLLTTLHPSCLVHRMRIERTKGTIAMIWCFDAKLVGKTRAIFQKG